MLAFAAVVFAVFIWDRFDLSSVCLTILMLLPALFFVFPFEGVEPYRFFAGFGHPALVAIFALMVLGHALVLTGALAPAARRLAWLVAKSPRMALLVVLVGAAAVSGVMNDTPVVVLLIPLLVAALQRANQAPGRMLLPMNYAVLMGGMSTTIGTSTNLIVVSLAVGLGLPRFGVFDFFPLVAIASVPALLYLWLGAPLLLRHLKPTQPQTAQPEFEAELRVTEGTLEDGAELREVIQQAGNNLPLVRIRRDNGAVMVPLPTARLRVGDRLVVRDTAENLKEYEARLQAPLHSQDEASSSRRTSDDGDDEEAEPMLAAQLIVTPDSPLVASTVRRERLIGRYDLLVIGLKRARGGSQTQREGLEDLKVHSGDVLLIQGPKSALQTVQSDGYGLLLDEQLALPRQGKSLIALFTLAAVVAAASVGGVPITLAALAGVLVLLATRTLAWHDVGGALSAKVALLVAASLALGDALTITGGTQFLASSFVALVADWPGAWVLAALMGMMGMMTNFVSNNAAAAIGTPLSIEIARALGLPPEPFVLAVLFGCNLCYLTPMGYQTNLLVMNAGGYRFGDFVRVGTPLFIIMWIGLSVLLAQRYGLKLGFGG
ncbi:MAG: SLC13 family permease [Burkholderiaceae bacterium]